MKIPSHTPIATLLPATLLLAAACGGSSSPEPSQSQIVPETPAKGYELPSDSDIMARVYDHGYSVPDGFFIDERASTPGSYSLYHVKDPSSSYELCSDDFATAQQWEAADNAARSVTGHYVGEYENGRYFEFVRELAFENDVGNIDDATSPGFARIFKCGSIDRDGVDRSLLDGYAGRLNMRPLTATQVRTATEYLWQFTFFPYAHKKVLDSYSGQTGEALQHTLVLAFGINQGDDRCDRIDVSAWQFSADRDTGELSKAFSKLHSFEARLRDGIPELCG